jgi:uncharacterized membrane protein
MGIESSLVIAASVERVWELTGDVESWPKSTPTMTSVVRLDDGALRVGSKARVVQPRQRPATWTVTRIERPHLFEWETKVLSITITASHRLEAAPDACRNTLTVELSGFGSLLLARLVGRKIREAIETENQGFKRTAETMVDPPGEPS